MAVAFRAAGTFASSAVGTPTVPYPAGVASGDLLIIQFAAGSTVLPTTPAGWTLLFGPTTMAGGSGAVGFVYWRVAGGSEPSSVTFAKTGANVAAGGIMTAYSGADTTTPVDVSATQNLSTGFTGTTPSVTTTKANTKLLRMYWEWTGGGAITPPGTDTERYDTVFSDFNLCIEMADSTQAAAGASGTTTASFSTNASGGMSATVAIAPLAAAASTFVPQIVGVI